MAEEGGEGFALDAYVTPKFGPLKPDPSYMMPKSTREVGGVFEAVQKAAKNPGPDHYNKEFLGQDFTKHAVGGKFGNLGREFPKSHTKNTPAVGQYDILTASGYTSASPRLKGGKLPQQTRGCYLYDVAVKRSKWSQAPGKYDGNKLPVHISSPGMTTTKTDSKSPRKPSEVGPGYYNVNHNQVDKRSVAYSSSKNPGKSFLDEYTKGKDKQPAPGHNGIPDSKVQDRTGQAKHSIRLLGDRIISPRGGAA